MNEAASPMWWEILKVTGQLAVAIIAWAAFYRTHLTRAKLSLAVGDSVRLVAGPGEGVTALHLICTVINEGARMGMLQHLEAQVQFPDGRLEAFVWRLFFKYVDDGNDVVPESHTYPIAVGPRESRPLFVELGNVHHKSRFAWTAGDYLVTLKGWVNSRARTEHPTLTSSFSFAVRGDQAADVSAFNIPPKALRVEILEWARR